MNDKKISFWGINLVWQAFMGLAVLFCLLAFSLLNFHYGFIVGQQLVLALFVGLMFFLAYFYRASLLLVMGLGGIIVLWFHITDNFFKIDLGRELGLLPFVIILLFCALYFLIGIAHRNCEKYGFFSSVYEVFAGTIVTWLFFMLSWRSFLWEISSFKFEYLQSNYLSISLAVLALSSLGLFLLNIFDGFPKKMVFPEIVGFFVFFFYIGLLLFSPRVALEHDNYWYYFNDSSGTGNLWIFWTNLFLFLELFAILLSGFLKRKAWLLNLGTILLFLAIVIKYFDWSYTFADKSLFFIYGGILMIVVGLVLEKSRRYFLEKLKNS